MQDRRAIKYRYLAPRIERKPTAAELPEPEQSKPPTGWKRRRYRCPACGRVTYHAQEADKASVRLTCYCVAGGTRMLVLMTETIS